MSPTCSVPATTQLAHCATHTATGTPTLHTHPRFARFAPAHQRFPGQATGRQPTTAFDTCPDHPKPHHLPALGVWYWGSKWASNRRSRPPWASSRPPPAGCTPREPPSLRHQTDIVRRRHRQPRGSIIGVTLNPGGWMEPFRQITACPTLPNPSPPRSRRVNVDIPTSTHTQRRYGPYRVSHHPTAPRFQSHPPARHSHVRH